MGLYLKKKCESANLSTLPENSIPIGGFNKSEFVGVNPNSTFETDYIFYSRNYGPGNVSLATHNPGNASISITPSVFFVEPNHTYKSRIIITTGPGFDTKYFSLNATFEPDSLHLADDEMTIYPIMPPGLLWVHQDSVTIENNEMFSKKDECKQYNLTYDRGFTSGLGLIEYSLDETPLNVTIIPSRFISKPGIVNPSKINIRADSSIAPGVYMINITVNGAGEWLYIDKGDQGTIKVLYASDEKVIPIKVIVE